MNVLLLGSGGREHALAWKLAQSPSLSTLYASPGNAGIAEEAECVALDVTDHTAVATFCRNRDIALVVIGPEAPLVDGLADSLRNAGLAVFGPSQAAARLEGSKGFTKDLCARAGIPTAGYVRTTSPDEARAALARFGAPFVLKADGLAAGKGVVIADDIEAAEIALADMFGGQFGEAGAEVVIEEFMAGEEASFFALTDGATIVPFGTAQDHKRVGEGDAGPNTGGMGAYSPAPVLTSELQTQVMAEIIEPTVATMHADGVPFVGVLYAGLMLTTEGPKLIEYNARFGDPECQVLMMMLRDDLARMMHLCATGKLDELDEASPQFESGAALTVVMAANGYPGTPEKGGAIDVGGPHHDRVKIFHAGTALKDGTLVANGGRVLNVTAMGANVAEAQRLAYEAVDKVSFPGGFCRRDIGHKEVARADRRERQAGE
ncbi:MAG: phosphoribosylamine--glycine ligase [Alphaproteobacteria bacterium]|jgi:phosphoribosylamine--glycine ligase|nr:phosphoribosylamine--glycine ligase [Alphaproteobacteria bacterium]